MVDGCLGYLGGLHCGQLAPQVESGPPGGIELPWFAISLEPPSLEPPCPSTCHTDKVSGKEEKGMERGDGEKNSLNIIEIPP